MSGTIFVAPGSKQMISPDGIFFKKQNKNHYSLKLKYPSVSFILPISYQKKQIDQTEELCSSR
jgi:hypothetical protein